MLIRKHQGMKAIWGASGQLLLLEEDSKIQGQRDLPSEGPVWKSSQLCLLLHSLKTAPLGFQWLIPESYKNENYDQTTSQEHLSKMQTRTNFNPLPWIVLTPRQLQVPPTILLQFQRSSLHPCCFPDEGVKWKIKPLEKSRKKNFNTKAKKYYK